MHILLLLATLLVANSSEVALLTYNFNDLYATGATNDYAIAETGLWHIGTESSRTGDSSTFGYTLGRGPEPSEVTTDGSPALFFRSSYGAGSILNPSDDMYFRFGITIRGLRPGETIDLSAMKFDLGGWQSVSGMGIGIFSDDYSTTIYDSLADGYTITDSVDTISVDLSSYTGLTNGQVVYFRIHYTRGISTNPARGIIVDNLSITGSPNILETETKIGIDFGPTITEGWNNITEHNQTIATGTVIDINGSVLPDLSISVIRGAFNNNDGTNNWIGLSENQGNAPVEFVDSVTTDIAGRGGIAPYQIEISGLDPYSKIDLTAVAAAAGNRNETLTVTGAKVYPSVSVNRSTTTLTGSFHGFVGVKPSSEGVLTIEATETTSNNPIINGILLTINRDNDFDSDGLTNEEESNIYFTDPYSADTDNDGSDDSIEVLEGTNPLLANNGISTYNLSGIESPGPIGSFLNGTLPTVPIGEITDSLNNWQPQQILSDASFNQAMSIEPVFNENKLIVTERAGAIYTVDYGAETANKTLFLDLSSKVSARGLGGAFDLAVHPEYGDPNSENRNYLYVWYTTVASEASGFSNPDGAFFIRLSRFTRDETTGTVPLSSELVMIQQSSGYARSFVHIAGGLEFGKDGFLYSSWGDMEHAPNIYAFYQDAQRIDRVFQCALLAIDVDQKGGDISSPPVHTLQGENGPNAITGTTQSCPTTHNWYHVDNFSGVGYYIPKTNYWHRDNNIPAAGTADVGLGARYLERQVSGERGESYQYSYPAHGPALEEHVAIGLRNSFRISTDLEDGDIAMFDVGSNSTDWTRNFEEVNILVQGGNYGWPYKEGNVLQEFETGISVPPGGNSAAPSMLGTDTLPLYAASHDLTGERSAIGGVFYYGDQFPSLKGKLICGDYYTGIRSIDYKDLETPVIGDTMFRAVGIRKICSSPDGEDILWVTAASIFKLTNVGTSEEPPATLSQTGAFSDIHTFTPSAGVISYDPIAPLWSDRAKKSRFMAIPNSMGASGVYDLDSEKITFSEDGFWTYPSGTVFIKNFTLPTDERDPDNPEKQHKVETRFMVKTEASGYYAFSYRWREDQTDADLIPSGDTAALSQDVSIIGKDGFTYTQTWEYPTRSQCFECHQVSYGESLGVNTRQLNKPHTYESGLTANQLTTLHSLGIFDQEVPVSAITNYLTSAYINDEEKSLEERVRSYLDSNCAYCHSPNSASGRALFDARLTTSLTESGLIDHTPEADSLGLLDPRIIKPGDPTNSLIYHRDASSDPETRMPPVGRELADQDYLTVLTRWIRRIGHSNFDRWASNNSVKGGFEDDRDGDGVNAFTEFLALGDPTSADQVSLNLTPTGVLKDTVTQQPTQVIFSWTVREDAVIGTDYEIELGSDFASFTQATHNSDYTLVNEESLGNGLKKLTITVPASNDTYFVRLTSMY